MKNSSAVSQNVKHRSTVWFHCNTSGFMCKRIEHICLPETCTGTFIALFLMAKKWKHLKCPSADKWINKIYTHAMKYHSAIKQHEVLYCCMLQQRWTLKHAMWKKASPKENIVWFYFYEMTRIGKFIEIENICCQGKEEWGVTAIGFGYLLGWWKCSKINGDSSVTPDMLQTSGSYTLVNFMVCEL